MTRIGIAILTAGLAAAGVVDRVAVTVGTHVITESEVLHEVRMTELTNQQPLDLSLEARKAAADRLVDQELIRNEMEIVSYPKATAQEAEAMLRKFRQEHYPSIPQFRAGLEKYGVTEDELKQYLQWELTVMRFTDQRFHVGLAPTATDGSADRQSSSESAPTPSVDDQMDAWLKQQRASNRIVFKKGAFAQ